MFEYEEVFQISGIVLATEQNIIKYFKFIFNGFDLKFRSTFTNLIVKVYELL